jgi:hypothetical protein
MHIAEMPPSLYGGTERVVSWLSNELVSLGDKATLFASGGSKTKTYCGVVQAVAADLLIVVRLRSIKNALERIEIQSSGRQQRRLEGQSRSH